jgi:hypothetical protein
MFERLKELLQRVINSTGRHQSDVEQYVTSKNPTSIAEVEYWVRQFDRRISGGRYGY